jgi:hypothetical protein
MNSIARILIALFISTIVAAILATLLGRALVLGSQRDVIRLGLVIFAIAAAISLPLFLALGRKR